MKLNNRQPESSLINQWVSDRFTGIIELMEDSMRKRGFNVRTEVTQDSTILMHVASNGRVKGSIDLSKVMHKIATLGEPAIFDRHLYNPFYEASKIEKVLASRIDTAATLFHSNDRQKIYNDLQTLSKHHGVNFVIVERD